MSIERMQDLSRVLHDYGWTVLHEERDEAAGSEKYEPDSDLFDWRIRRESDWCELKLSFYICGLMGERSLAPRDISYCRESTEGLELMFQKRSDPKWAAGLTAFVIKLNEVANRRARGGA